MLYVDVLARLEKKRIVFKAWQKLFVRKKAKVLALRSAGSVMSLIEDALDVWVSSR